jgi:hypothetical protein
VPGAYNGGVADVFSRRNALLGWLVWKLAKRRLRQRLRADGEPARRRRSLRGNAVVAVLAGLAAVWARRSAHEDGTKA